MERIVSAEHFKPLIGDMRTEFRFAVLFRDGGEWKSSFSPDRNQKRLRKVLAYISAKSGVSVEEVPVLPRNF